MYVRNVPPGDISNWVYVRFCMRISYDHSKYCLKAHKWHVYIVIRLVPAKKFGKVYFEFISLVLKRDQ